MKGDAGWYYQSASQNDWDLNAVVRYACGGRVSQPRPSDDPFASFLPPAQEPAAAPAPDVTTTMGAGPSSLLPELTPKNYDDPLAVVDELSIAYFVTQSQLALQPPPPPPQPPQPPVAVPDEAAPVPPPVAQITVGQASGVERPRSKKQYVTKKRHAKKIVKKRVAVGAASEADPWAWRKYGQKTIKDSPYSRSYYRCSTAKECGARKMMELCPTDPDTLILTYTGADHNHPAPLHRNSLAGTTRNRQQRRHHLPSSPPRQHADRQSPGPSTSPSTEMEMEDQDDDDADDLLKLLNEATDTGGHDGEWR